MKAHLSITSALFPGVMAETALMKILVRACGYANPHQFNQNDLITFKDIMAKLSGIQKVGMDW